MSEANDSSYFSVPFYWLLSLHSLLFVFYESAALGVVIQKNIQRSCYPV